MNLRQLLERRAAIATELRALNEQHPEALPTEAQTRWDAMRSEMDALQGRIDRQAIVDDAERRAAGQPVNGSGDRHLDVEIRNFSVVRAMAAAAGLNVDAGREREISAEVARRSGRNFQGICVPMAALEQRVVSTTTPSGATGANVIGTNLMAGEFIDPLRAALVVRRLGARVLSGLVGNVDIPKQTASATAAWVAENSALSASDQSFGQVSLTPKHAGAITEFSRNMLLQSTPDIEQIMRADLSAILAQALDTAAINGSGTSNQPKGILNTTGIGSVAMGTNGDDLTYDAVADLLGEVDDDNANVGSLAYLTNTKVRRAAAKLKDGQGIPLGLDMVFQGMPRAFTTNVPSNLTKGTSTSVCSALIYGNWSDLLIGMWSELDILVNPYESTAYSKGNVQVRAMMTCDISVRHPESFAAIKDITTA
jgi:HK97 family phage major capsid protein